MGFDPDAPAAADSGLYGLSCPPDEAQVVVVPVPWEATVSYRAGTARGPAAVLAASHQVDLLDGDVGTPYTAGVAMLPPAAEVLALGPRARARAREVLDALAAGEAPPPTALAEVNAAGAALNGAVYEAVRALLAQGKLPVVLGGDHSVPFGAIAACAEGRGALGVLHLDAHADLRLAYEGFTWSHASILRNVVDRLPNVQLVQVGIRDFSEGELAFIRDNPGRVSTWFDRQLRTARLEGRFRQVCAELVQALPHEVYLSFDIDGLDPQLCPNTGTPVPGGLGFDEVITLLEALVASGRVIVGLDLVEVSPGPERPAQDDFIDEWDALVGARLLYKMIGFALISRGQAQAPELPTPSTLR